MSNGKCVMCRERDRSSETSQICGPCRVCAHCGATSGTMAMHSFRLYCEVPDCYTNYLDESEKRREKTQRVNDAQIPPKQAKARLEKLDSGQRKIADDYLANPVGNLIIYGGSGTGKTWTAAATLRALIDRGPSGRWLSLPMMFATIRDKIGGEQKFEITALVRELTCYDYIVLDDLGANRATDWAVETLYLVLDQWEAMDRTGMIVTTNLTMEQIAQNFSDRIASRLAHSCRVVKLDGQDKRLKR